ncbi:uncharacterized protein N7529_009251 [Penicillium soppii]|uniref:uncharacterized protein n=1 Tax=Penicillium soppii TaxID=69789 RepID=UPI00254842DB|nr:uncharacterized protein N7529_009251 [Penicillium soppii]KAJ5861941.1 hypothetical protein N7529_009251 [Penicillium soppii]
MNSTTACYRCRQQKVDRVGTLQSNFLSYSVNVPETYPSAGVAANSKRAANIRYLLIEGC